MQLQEKVAYLFNKYYSGFLKTIKECNEDLRTIVKANYKLIDKKSTEYCDAFAQQLNEHVPKLIKKDTSTAYDKDVCQGITVAHLFEKAGSEHIDIVWSYLHVLLLMSYLYTLDADEVLFEKVTHVLSAVQKGQDVQDEVQEVLDDDLRELLLLASRSVVLRDTPVKDQPPTKDDFDLPDIFAGLQNSKIANLAREISKDVDVSSLQTQDPQDMIKNMLDFSSSNNMLGNIVGKVSSTLHDKIAKGELNQQDLLQEAMSMMSLMNNSGGANNIMSQFASNPMFNQMMKSFQAGNMTPRSTGARSSDTRDRLRKKLEDRKKNVE